MPLKHIPLVVHVMYRNDRPPLRHESCRHDGDHNAEHDTRRKDSAGRQTRLQEIATQAENDPKGREDSRGEPEGSFVRWMAGGRTLNPANHDSHGKHQPSNEREQVRDLHSTDGKGFERNAPSRAARNSHARHSA